VQSNLFDERRHSRHIFPFSSPLPFCFFFSPGSGFRLFQVVYVLSPLPADVFLTLSWIVAVVVDFSTFFRPLLFPLIWTHREGGC